MMQMALSNAVHPEYGVVTISFPIPEEEYGHCLELLEALEIGNAVNRDCKVQEVQDGPPILKRLEGSRVNLDELDYAELMAREKYPDLPSELFQTPQAAQIGRTMLEEGNGAITEYGLIRRTDGRPLPVFTGKPQREEFAGPQMTGM